MNIYPRPMLYIYNYIYKLNLYWSCTGAGNPWGIYFGLCFLDSIAMMLVKKKVKSTCNHMHVDEETRTTCVQKVSNKTDVCAS